jgi:hypothetical protein
VTDRSLRSMKTILLPRLSFNSPKGYDYNLGI